jgi:dethiobiotin synthetase
MRGVFVTGTDTGVGKTLFSTALLLRLGAEGIRAAACKPVAGLPARGRTAGERGRGTARGGGAPRRPAGDGQPRGAGAGDRAAHRRRRGRRHARAGSAGRGLPCGGAGAEFLVVEGAGGWRVPLSASATLADVAIGLNFPVVLVVGLRLGCLNHALLSAEAIRADGLRLAGWVANPLAEPMPRLEENIATLTARLGAPLLARLPACDAGDPMLRARQAAAALPPGLAARLGPGEAIRDCT